MTQPPVAVIIVTYNSGQVLEACLQSLRDVDANVVVVDNASQDATLEVAARLQARVIRNSTNLGFAAAVNQGVLATGASFLVILNPDAVLETSLDALLEQCGEPSVGAVGGQLVSLQGRPQAGFNIRRFPTPTALAFEAMGVNRLWPENPVNWRYRCLDVDLSQPAEVEQPAGAFLMFRREAWELVGGFDRGFFPVWFEDVDFCKRLSNAGFRVFYRPDAVALHQGAHSIDSLTLGKRTEYWYRSLLRYSSRHFDSAGRTMTCAGVIVGSFLRLIVGGTKNWNRAMIRSYGVVVKLAFRSIRRGKVQFGEVLP